MINISRVDNIVFEGSHYYDDKKFDNYILWLEGYNEPLRMTKYKDITSKRDIPVTGNMISYDIDGNRLKNVKILYKI